MNIAYDLNGSQVGSVKEYDIATGTAIALGQVVMMTAGKVVLAATTQTTAILGVAYENHPGTVDAFNFRANGTRIKVMDAASSIFECPAPQIVATGGSAIAFVASTISGFADSDFVGGRMKLYAKGATSVITDPINTVYNITASTGASGTLTCAGITGGCTAGDTFIVFPPFGLQKGLLDATIQKLLLTGVTATVFSITSDSENQRNMLQLKAELHQMANKKS